MSSAEAKTVHSILSSLLTVVSTCGHGYMCVVVLLYVRASHRTVARAMMTFDNRQIAVAKLMHISRVAQPDFALTKNFLVASSLMPVENVHTCTYCKSSNKPPSPRMSQSLLHLQGSVPPREGDDFSGIPAVAHGPEVIRVHGSSVGALQAGRRL